MTGSIPPANPLSYEGQVVVPFIQRGFPPTTSFNTFPVPTLWIDNVNENAYLLVAKPLGVADWILLGGAPGNLNTLTGDVGGAISPIASNIDIIGGTDVTVTGDPLTGTLTIDVNGGTGLLTTLTGNMGGPISPLAGNTNIIGSGSITITGIAHTLTAQLIGLTDHNLLVGQGTDTIGTIAPSATSGIPVVSAGVAADPIYGTVVVAGGGTGSTSFTAYSPIVGGVTATSALQAADTGIANVGYVLTSTGAASVPTWQASASVGVVTKVVRQVFNYTGGAQTYTPSSGMLYADVEILGGGGGGGGCPTVSANYVACAGAGGAGGYAKKLCTAAQIGVSKTITIGSGGTGGAAGSHNGITGGTTAFGALFSATGGGGGNAGNQAPIDLVACGIGGTGVSGDVNGVGASGTFGIGISMPFPALSSTYFQHSNNSMGGSTIYGGSINQQTCYTGGIKSSNGSNAVGYGSGGNGGAVIVGGAAPSGGNGAPGICIVTEYCS